MPIREDSRLLRLGFLRDAVCPTSKSFTVLLQGLWLSDRGSGRQLWLRCLPCLFLDNKACFKHDL